jgi:hypothetical protein
MAVEVGGRTEEEEGVTLMFSTGLGISTVGWEMLPVPDLKQVSHTNKYKPQRRRTISIRKCIILGTQK